MSDLRATRVLPSVVLATVLAFGATACSGDSPGKDTSSSSTSSDKQKARTALDAGLQAHSTGDLTTAAADYRKTLKYDPANKFALYNLALIDEASGNYGLAEQKYRLALQADAEYEPALFNLAILRTGRDPEEATALYKKAVAANPKDASAWLNLGLLQRAAGDATEGNKSVSHAIGLNPKLKDPSEAASAKQG
jgi:tetratricopeptide (TPR) repeat protein